MDFLEQATAARPILLVVVVAYLSLVLVQLYLLITKVPWVLLRQGNNQVTMVQVVQPLLELPRHPHLNFPHNLHHPPVLHSAVFLEALLIYR